MLQECCLAQHCTRTRRIEQSNADETISLAFASEARCWQQARTSCTGLSNAMTSIGRLADGTKDTGQGGTVSAGISSHSTVKRLPCWRSSGDCTRTISRRVSTRQHSGNEVSRVHKHSISQSQDTTSISGGTSVHCTYNWCHRVGK